MRYIETLHEGDRIQEVYLCKQKSVATSKNGKQYMSLVLQDKTGTVDAKIWDLNSGGIGDFDVLSYVDVMADVTVFNGAFQLNVKRIRKAGEHEYKVEDYLPISRYSIDGMYQVLLQMIDTVKAPHYHALLKAFFVDDAAFIERFKQNSAAKTMHHGFVGGLLEHSLSVAKLCAYYCKRYDILDYNLLITAALLHDIGKTREISLFPVNDYTDDGNLLGHIVMGYEMIGEKIKGISDFPKVCESELKHCILAHHGELEYGSPKKPALAEAVALNLADNTDARMEGLTELFLGTVPPDGSSWYGYNKMFESNLRKTTPFKG